MIRLSGAHIIITVFPPAGFSTFSRRLLLVFFCLILSPLWPSLFCPATGAAQLLILTSGRERLSWEPPQELKRQMKEIPFFLSPSCFDYYYDDTSTTTTNNNYYYHRGQTSFSFVPCIEIKRALRLIVRTILSVCVCVCVVLLFVWFSSKKMNKKIPYRECFLLF